MKKHIKKILWLFLTLFILGNIIVYNHAYRFTHFVEGNGEKRKKPEELSFGEKLEAVFFGVSIPKPINKETPQRPYTTIDLQSHKKLKAWLIEIPQHKGVVLLCHGYSGSKSGVLNYAEEFNKKGYTTLLLDFMGNGDSEGYQTTIGVKESRDVKVAYEYLKTQYPQDSMILFGSSMGAVAIMKSVYDFDIKPDKLILECPFGTMRQTTQTRFTAMGLPAFPFADMLMIYGGLQNGFNAYSHKPTEYAKSISIPTLLMCGAEDKRVSKEETKVIFENLKGEKSLYFLKGLGHENYLWNGRKMWLKYVFEK